MDKKTVYMLVIAFVILFPIFTIASVTTWNGYLFFEEWGLFSTRTGYSHYYHGEDNNIWINETRYFSKCRIYYNVNSKDGFLVGNDITLNITNGFVEFYTEGIPDVDNITIRIDLEPGYKITEVNAIFDGDKRFEFDDLNYNLNIQYIVSGAKGIRAYAEYNDSNLTKPHIENYGSDNYIDIDPPYITTQLKLAKSVVILTYWVIFLSLVTAVLRFRESNDEEIKNDNKKECESMKKKLLKYFPNGFYWLSVFIIAIGIISLIIGAIVYGVKGNDVTLTGASILITLGIGCFSLGFAFLSIGIAKESDKKMEANANESFLKIWDTFGNKTISFLNQIRNGNLSSTEYMAWKCETYMERAFDLMETSEIKLKNRKKLYNVYLNLLKQFPWQGKIIDGVLIKDNVVTLTDAKNLLNVYKKIRKNHLYDEKSDELIHLFDPFVKDIDSKITIDKQIDKFIGEINETKKILEEIHGRQRRYSFMRLEQAKRPAEQKMKKKNGKKKDKLVEKRDFDEFWKELIEVSSRKQTIQNWTAKNGYIGEDFTAVYVLDPAKKEKERIEMNVSSAKNPIIPVKKHSFKNVYPLWDGYIKGKILRKEIRDITRHSKYIISTMHQFENLMYK